MSFMEDVSDVSESSNYDEWITSFCSRFGHEFFCQVPTEFIEDDFNLTGLSAEVPHYRRALDLILDLESLSEEDEDGVAASAGAASNGGDHSNGTSVRQAAHADGQPINKSIIDHCAEQLYGLIHARYILTKQGLQAMAEKFDHKEFGTCPRYYCGGMQLLPCGLSDTLGKNTVRLYCASCQDLYLPHSSRHLCLEGAFWGTSFPGVFLKHFKELEDYVEQKNKNVYRLRIFGFPVAKESISGPRMEWLRQYPSTEAEWQEFEKCEYEILKLEDQE
ncbi:AGR163Wp [Eremothecium gossypii ATCC 10895]|uniref:Casein kinase II subunit beta n=1 Tax=Eremothecium gossypii (strain ATCC 10895 / CBS 109.51 / FGSC 9923 / NRRL Y-1056) TaxID=284811 RepID=Q74ZN5_EREGS|nr:AGR163Wp [Eremothecium gossypii ATCC 10895]AAS54653.1 AGR163Wp [Eremothecium gossypii ATCC 10895]AEY98983.1 FAGR163Wp [Eremothecium gossypii FDAG1]